MTVLMLDGKVKLYQELVEMSSMRMMLMSVGSGSLSSIAVRGYLTLGMLVVQEYNYDALCYHQQDGMSGQSAKRNHGRRGSLCFW
jgi:hypothetical protein